QMQGSVDAAALAAAYRYMTTTDYAQSEQGAETVYASNERLYGTPSCAGYGTTAVTCTFGDPSGHVLTIAVSNRSVAGVSFTVTGRHVVVLTVMQVLGSGPTISVSATATAVARVQSTAPAGIQTLSSSGCGGSGSYSLSAGVYSWQSGLTLNGGFLSNELRPPDEPALTATTAALSGTVSSLPVGALSVAVPGGSTVTVGGQALTVTAAGAPTGATS